MVEHLHEEFVDALRMGFVDASKASDSRYAPKLLTNDESTHSSVLLTLKAQLSQCERFDFAVAFITTSGVQTLVELLRTLREKNVKGRIITTTFNNFNDPEALRKLLEYPNIEVRVFEGNMHAKGYFFENGDINAVIIGSANLTQSALCVNKEWSIMLHSYREGEVFQAARREYELLWTAAETVPLSYEWIDEYESYRNHSREGAARVRPSRAFTSGRYAPAEPQVEVAGAGTTGRGMRQGTTWVGINFEPGQLPQIKPNAMQRDALASLKGLHAEGAGRALLISATGTGKTYLSAFDVRETEPKKVLFVAHRKRILEASKKSFEKVLGNRYRYGFYGGSSHDKADCLFAMVGSLARHLDEFDPLEFDYIIIDETHRAGAAGYRKLLEFFAPEFVLGMTATPQRSDGYDIFELYNHVIAYRISLQDALREDMLAPFHYYGVADIRIDDEEQDETAVFNRLTSADRVDHILQKLEDYSVSKRDRRGLVFCSRVEEAKTLSAEFNKRGYRTCALSGENSDIERDRAVERLEGGDLQYILSVDIFNEGVDIPTVNQIVMLRPTESAIVFVQQLGRGLRKAPGKEAVLVLDFIGNYQNNYLIPIALSGDRTYDKDSLRRFVKEGSSIIPGCSTVSFDRVAEERIFEKLDSARFSSTALIRQEYTNLKLILGRIPKLEDFDAQEMIDPLLIFDKFGSYHAFLSKYEPEYQAKFSTPQEQMLRYVSQKLASGKRSAELVVLRELIEKKRLSANWFDRRFAGKRKARAMASVMAQLTCRFVLAGQKKSFEHCVFVGMENGSLALSEAFARALENERFREEMLEVIDFGLERSDKIYSNLFEDTGFVLYEKYTYEDVCRLLEWDTNVPGQNIGGYKYDEATNTFPVFINYEKDPDISDTIKYEDRFVSDRELIAISKQPRTEDSPEILRLKQIDENGMQPYLFVRKNKKDSDGGKEFYFLGKMRPTQEYNEITMPNTNKTAVEITYRLDVPVRPDIFDYLTSSIS